MAHPAKSFLVFFRLPHQIAVTQCACNVSFKEIVAEHSVEAFAMEPDVFGVCFPDGLYERQREMEGSELVLLDEADTDSRHGLSS